MVGENATSVEVATSVESACRVGLSDTLSQTRRRHEMQDYATSGTYRSYMTVFRALR